MNDEALHLIIHIQAMISVVWSINLLIHNKQLFSRFSGFLLVGFLSILAFHLLAFCQCLLFVNVGFFSMFAFFKGMLIFECLMEINFELSTRSISSV